MAGLRELMVDKGPAVIAARPVTAKVGVGREGSLVVLQIGDSAIRMKWRDAMRLAQWLGKRATECKIFDGEGGKRILLG